MRRFRITFRDSTAGEAQQATFRGHDPEHAEQRFWDSFDTEGGSEGVQLLSVVEIDASGKLRQVYAVH